LIHDDWWDYPALDEVDKQILAMQERQKKIRADYERIRKMRDKIVRANYQDDVGLAQQKKKICNN